MTHIKGETRRAVTTSLPLAIVLLLAIPPPPAHAATITALGGATFPCGSNWSTATHWDLGHAPQTGDDVVWGAGLIPSITNYDLAAGVQLHSLTVNSVGACSGSFQLTGGTTINAGTPSPTA